MKTLTTLATLALALPPCGASFAASIVSGGAVERLGVGAEVRGKETRYGDGASVIEHVIHGAGDEIGFGAMTEISLYLDKGAQFAGPLPADVQNYTAYVAAPAAAPADAAGAAAFLKFLGSPAARAAFQAKGVE